MTINKDTTNVKDNKDDSKSEIKHNIKDSNLNLNFVIINIHQINLIPCSFVSCHNCQFNNGTETILKIN